MLNIDAENKEELLGYLRSVDITVPPRSQGRSTEHCERWSICRFLSTYSDSDLIRFPMELSKRERPDFLLHNSGSEIGVEVTEAIPPDWAWADARRQKLKHGTSVLLQRFRPGEPQRTKKEVDHIASGKAEGSGWAGDSVERDWAEIMEHFSLEKKEKAEKPGYKRFMENWLLIYDNWPLPVGFDEAKAAAYFIDRLRSLDETLPFDRVFVECASHIWQFSNTGHAPREILDLWKSS